MQLNWLFCGIYACWNHWKCGRTQRKAATINQFACPNYSLYVQLLLYPMYYPGEMKARVSSVQWSKPYSILASTQDSNPGSMFQNHKRWPLHIIRTSDVHSAENYKQSMRKVSPPDCPSISKIMRGQLHCMARDARSCPIQTVYPCIQMPARTRSSLPIGSLHGRCQSPGRKTRRYRSARSHSQCICATMNFRWTASKLNWKLIFSWPHLGYIYHLICSSCVPTRYFISWRV